jgi:predicted amidohydrolase
MDTFTVTVGQLALSDPWDVYEQIHKTFLENPQTDLFVFPEFATQDSIDPHAIAYLKEDPQAWETVQKWLALVPPFSRVKTLSDELGKAVLIGCIAQDGKGLYSRAYFYDPKCRQLEFYNKTHVHWTEGFLRPGDTIEPMPTRFGKMGVLICYDMAFVEPTRVHGIKGAELLFALSAIPMDFHWKYPHYRMIGAAIFNQYYVIAANLGYTHQAPMGGHSGIYSPEGDLLAQVKSADFGYVSADIDLGCVRRWREKEKIDPYRRPDLYKALTAHVDGE